MMPFRLIAADLDGTILDHSNRLKPQLLSAINKCRSQGVELVISTGRLYPSAKPIIDELSICLPVISSNGAVIKDPLSGELIYHMPLPRELAIEALMLTKGDSAQRFICIQDSFYTDVSQEEAIKYSKALNVTFVRHVPLESIITDDPTIIVVKDREDEIARLTTLLTKNLGSKVHIANSTPCYIDINHPKVSKGAGLMKVCKLLGINPKEVIAVGDGWNDLEMFEVAGLGAAVSNAPRDLKRKADYICKNHSYKGVIEVLERFVLI